MANKPLNIATANHKYFLITNMIIIIMQNIFLLETKFLSIWMRVRVGPKQLLRTG